MEEICIPLFRPAISHICQTSPVSATPDTHICLDSESDGTPDPPVHWAHLRKVTRCWANAWHYNYLLVHLTPSQSALCSLSIRSFAKKPDDLKQPSVTSGSPGATSLPSKPLARCCALRGSPVLYWQELTSVHIRLRVSFSLQHWWSPSEDTWVVEWRHFGERVGLELCGDTCPGIRLMGSVPWQPSLRVQRKVGAMCQFSQGFID